MKATEVIKRDHVAASDLFEKYKKANMEDREVIAEDIFEALDAHEAMEDTYFYPALKEKMQDDPALQRIEDEQEALEEHVEKVRTMEGDRDEAIKGMMEVVLAHAQKEEAEILSRADELFSAEENESLGEEMEPESAVALSEEVQEDES